MRFFCDHNVDDAVARRLRQIGHDVWTASSAGLALERDDDLTVYADEKRAVLLTHDREFSQRRRRNVVGQHIWLRCDEDEAPDVMERCLPDIAEQLERGHDVWIELSVNGVSARSRRWE